jgi:hypothetical protein
MTTHPLTPPMLGRVVLHCDGPACKPRRRFTSRSWSARRARVLAARYGWRFLGENDLCEDCVGPVQAVAGHLAEGLRRIHAVMDREAT